MAAETIKIVEVVSTEIISVRTVQEVNSLNAGKRHLNTLQVNACGVELPATFVEALVTNPSCVTAAEAERKADLMATATITTRAKIALRADLL